MKVFTNLVILGPTWALAFRCAYSGGMLYSGLQIDIKPPFTLLQAYADYQDIMVLTEDLIKAAAQAVTGGLEVDYQGQHLDFEQPFRRVSMHELVKEVTGDPNHALQLNAWGCMRLRDS